MKTCKRGHEMTAENSIIRKDSVYPRCRACHNLSGRRRYVETRGAGRVRARERGRAIIDKAKARPCADCGQTYPPYVMDFDHRDPETKEANVARLVTASEDTILAEVAKCDVVCANCHRERTHG